MERGAVVVPVRSFAGGYTRLASHLDAEERATLARAIAEHVVDVACDAVGAPSVAIVTSAGEVAAWAAVRGCAVLPDPGSLDAAATTGRDWALGRGAAVVAIVHGDLPRAHSLEPLLAPAGAGTVAAVADRHGDGTPALAVPTAAGFAFAYGPGSFARHRAEAARLGLRFVAVDAPDLAFDVDDPDDLLAHRLLVERTCDR